MSEFDEITAYKRTLDEMRKTREKVFQNTGKELQETVEVVNG